MNRNLTLQELIALLSSVFQPHPDDRALTLFLDLPDARRPDNPAWMDRRRIAAEWYVLLAKNMDALPFAGVNCCVYPNVGTNNGELPQEVSLVEGQARSSGKQPGQDLPLQRVLQESSVVIAMTELSATAPLKVLARKIGFRGATMPGFNRMMLPALGLDYEKVNARVMQIKERLDRADSARMSFMSQGENFSLEIDLRGSEGHASGGLIREPGTVANLPSGEAYAVPFEGEGERRRSRTAGTLPVQFGSEVVLFQIEENKAVAVKGTGPETAKQAAMLVAEPAYGNIAELGIGVLGDWGVQPVGNTLLDEKLGPHVAFGRSDHFGGKTGPSSFRDPKNVVHIDWVYVPSCQPLVKVESISLTYEGGSREEIIRSGRLAV